MKKRKRRLIKAILSVLLPMVLITGIAYALTLPYFDIDTIETEGLVHCSVDEIIAVSGIETGVNAIANAKGGFFHMLVLRYRQAEYNILKYSPYIKSVIVRYVPPSAVHIGIVERTPVFMIPYIGKYLLVDDECVPADASAGSGVDAGDPELPVLKGLVFEKYLLGKPLQLQAGAEGFANALEFMGAAGSTGSGQSSGDVSREAAPFLLAARITQIDVSDPKNFIAVVESRLTVNFGRLEEMDYRIGFLKVLIQGDLKYGKGKLDFTAGKNPVFTPEY